MTTNHEPPQRARKTSIRATGQGAALLGITLILLAPFSAAGPLDDLGALGEGYECSVDLQETEAGSFEVVDETPETDGDFNFTGTFTMATLEVSYLCLDPDTGDLEEGVLNLDGVTVSTDFKSQLKELIDAEDEPIDWDWTFACSVAVSTDSLPSSIGAPDYVGVPLVCSGSGSAAILLCIDFNPLKAGETCFYVAGAASLGFGALTSGDLTYTITAGDEACTLCSDSFGAFGNSPAFDDVYDAGVILTGDVDEQCVSATSDTTAIPTVGGIPVPLPAKTAAKAEPCANI